MQALYEAGKEIRQARESLRLAVWNGWSLARYTLFLGGGDTQTSPDNERRYHEMLSAVSSDARKIAREYIQGWKSLLPVVVFRAGLYAKPMPSLVTGYRLGKPPASMQSTNHRDGGRENGVSCLIVKQEGEAITNSDRGYMETAKAFYGQGRIHKVFWYLNTVETGSDGEPLVVVLSHG
ncbi:MAG: hypothetical protein M0Q48_04750 [Verrucomicrobia bacterium]|nr:hypothetical protein [Verrucomicrobiota bacterium]